MRGRDLESRRHAPWSAAPCARRSLRHCAQTSLLALAAIVGMALSGCEDANSRDPDGLPADATIDDGQSDPDLVLDSESDGETDGPDADAPGDARETSDACTVLGCPRDQFLDADACRCVDNLPCTTNADCPGPAALCNGLVCERLLACAENADCPSGEFCGADGGCVPGDCSGFFDNDCDAGENCLPAGNDAYICIPEGMNQLGASCDTLDSCASGLLCVGGTCEQPDCAPLGGTPACQDANHECNGIWLDEEPVDIGFCIYTCDPWAAEDECGTEGDGLGCVPFTSGGGGESPRGICREVGTADHHDPCDPSSSDQSLHCRTYDGTDGQLGCVAGRCELVCDPTDESTCPAELACRSGSTDGSTPTWGICIKPCTPWVAPEDTGCDNDEYCRPDFELSGQGQCVPSLTPPDATAAGERCDTDGAAPCEDGTVCLATSDEQGNAIEECFTMCDPTAIVGDDGACAADADGNDRACAALFHSQTTTVLAVGTCFADACDVATATPCPLDDDGSEQVCVTGAFNLSAVDFCTTLDADPVGYFSECPSADYDEFAICNENAMCVDLGAPTDNMIQCVELCDGTESGFGAPGHPECVNNVNDGLTATTCTQFFNAPLQNLGVCQPE